MSSNFFGYLFVVLLIADTLWQSYLSWRQQRSVYQHRSQVPKQFQQHIQLTEHQKAADYTIDKQRFGRLQLMLSAIITYVWTIQGGLAWLQQWVSQYFASGFTHALLLVAVFSLISALVSMPLSLYNTFVIEQKHGFNRTSLKLYITDAIKGFAVSAIIGVPLLWLLLWIMEHFLDQLWWLYAASLMFFFQLVMVFIYPNYIAPLFNRFEPLADQALKQKINQLAEQCGFVADDIKVMDGSKRSSHGNAYFTGFGKIKKIVFFDTLLKNLNHDQILAVLAHELGHFAHQHIIKRLIYSVLIIFLSLFVLDWLIASDWFYQAFGVEPSNIIALMLFSLLIPAFSNFLTPLFAQFSRKHEFQADAYAAEKTQADDLISALLSLYRDNASTLTPDSLYARWYASHPEASERIGSLSKAT